MEDNIFNLNININNYLAKINDIDNQIIDLLNYRKNLLKNVKIITIIYNKYKKILKKRFLQWKSYIIHLKILRNIFDKLATIYYSFLLSNYLYRWNNKINKLKQREDLLMKGMDEIGKRQLIISTDFISDVQVKKRVQ